MSRRRRSHRAGRVLESRCVPLAAFSRCYLRVAEVWRRIDAWLQKHESQLPPIRASLNDAHAHMPAEQRLRTIQQQMRSAQVEWKQYQVDTRRRVQAEIDAEKAPRRAARRAAAADAASSAPDVPMSDAPSAPPSVTRGDAPSISAALELAADIGLPTHEEVQHDSTSFDGFPLVSLPMSDELMCSYLLYNGYAPRAHARHVRAHAGGEFDACEVLLVGAYDVRLALR
jgi:hypothetical protein